MADNERNKKDGLTDMSAVGYNVEDAKARHEAKRRARSKQIRAEGTYTEDGELFKKAFDWQIMRRILGYLKPYGTQLSFGIILLLSYSAIAPAFPSLIGRAIDRYINPQEAPFTGLDTDAKLQGILTIVLIYLSLKVLNFGLRYGYTYLIAWLGQHVIYDLRKEIFTKIQRLHMGFFDRTPVGRLMTRITSDVDAIQNMMTNGVVGLIADIGIIVGLTVYMLSINWQLALVTLAVMPLLFITLNMLRLRIRDAYRAVRLQTSRSNAFLAENLNGMKTVQIFNREGAECSRLRRNQSRLTRRQYRAGSLVQPVLSIGAVYRFARASRDSRFWRLSGDGRKRPYHRRSLRLYPVRTDVLPPPTRPLGQVQHHASGDGLVRAGVRPARH